jgi:hypothetical protein
VWGNSQNIDFTEFLEEFRFDYFDNHSEIVSEDILNRYLKIECNISSQLDSKTIYNELIKDFNTRPEVESE